MILMRNAVHLPFELLDRVVGYVIDDRDHAKTLYNLSLVRHEWKAAVSARLCSKFEYDGDRQSILSLYIYMAIPSYLASQ